MPDDNTRGLGTEAEGYVGPTDHGPDVHDEADGAKRLIFSTVWGGQGVNVNSEHGQDVRAWNPTCSWYQYGLQLCLNGCQHPGMDIGLQRGTKLFAAQDGKVEFAGWAKYYRPHHVDIRTDGGDLHIYGHMWEVDPNVVVGGRVTAGQYLGLSGEQTIAGTMNPDGSGPHLHFEVRSGGCAVDPEPVLLGAPPAVPPKPFASGEVIEVFDGPLRLRSAGSLAGNILASLATGTKLTVTGGPVESDGHTWYSVRQDPGAVVGWVAGRFCRLSV